MRPLLQVCDQSVGSPHKRGFSSSWPTCFSEYTSCGRLLVSRFHCGGENAMSQQKEVLREIARVISGNGPFRIEEWFTEDFRLIEPTKPNWPRGYEGASKLLELFR